MESSKLSIKEKSQAMRLCLSLLAVVAAVPLVLGTKTPVQTSPSGSPIIQPVGIKPAGQTTTLHAPAKIDLRPQASDSNNSSIDTSLNATLDANQLARDYSTAQQTLNKQNEPILVRQKARPIKTKAPSLTVARPTSPTTPVSGRGGSQPSPAPTPATPPTTPTTPAPQTPPTTTPAPPPETDTTPPDDSGTEPPSSPTTNIPPSNNSGTVNGDMRLLARTRPPLTLQRLR